MLSLPKATSRRGRRSFSIPSPKRRFRPQLKTHAARTRCRRWWSGRPEWFAGCRAIVPRDAFCRRQHDGSAKIPTLPSKGHFATHMLAAGTWFQRDWRRWPPPMAARPRCPSDAFGKRPGRKTFRSSCGPSKSSPSRSASRATTPCSQPLNNCRRRRRKLNSTRFVSCWHKATRWPTRSGLSSRVCRTASRIQP